MIQFASSAGFVLCLAGAGMGALAFYFPEYRGWAWVGGAATLLVLGVGLIMLARSARGDGKVRLDDVVDSAVDDLLD